MKSLLRLLQKYSYVLVFILLETLAVIMLSYRNHYQHSKLLNATREITGLISDRVDGTREYLSLRTNNKALVRENTALRNRLEKAHREGPPEAYYNPEVARKYHYTAARVVHSTVYKQYNYLTINRGRKQGIERDMGVMSDRGVVGIVLDASANYATVLPVINLDFRLSTKIMPGNYAGILLWTGESPLFATMRELPHHAEFQKGDTIVTSGYSAIFPEGLPVGTISKYSLEEGNFYEIRVSLFTRFQQLFYVNVINNFLQDEQRTLEKESQPR